MLLTEYPHAFLEKFSVFSGQIISGLTCRIKKDITSVNSNSIRKKFTSKQFGSEMLSIKSNLQIKICHLVNISFLHKETLLTNFNTSML